MSVVAPSQSVRPPVEEGDGGTAIAAVASAIRDSTVASQNTRW